MSRFYDNLWRQHAASVQAGRPPRPGILNGPAVRPATQGLGAVDRTFAREVRAWGHVQPWAAWVLTGDPGELGHLNALPAGGMPVVQSPVQQAAAEETVSAPQGGLLVLVGGALVTLLVLAWLLPQLNRRGAR